jgi:hypothetical protein
MTPEDIEPRVSAGLKLLQHEIDDSDFYARNGFRLEQVMLMVAGKALRVALAVCQLVATGFYGEAFGLTRSVLEAFFIAKYISSKDGEARARSYMEFWKAHYYNQEQIRKQYFPDVEPAQGLTQQILDDAKKLSSTRHWVPAYNMASEHYNHPREIDPETGKGMQSLGDYDGMYETASHYVHCTVISSMPNYTSSPFRMPQYDREENRGFLALYFSLVYAVSICIFLGRHWERELRDEVQLAIHTLLAELRALSSPTGHWAVGRQRQA